MIHFAIAVNSNNELIPTHFGDADFFLIYQWENNEWTFHEKEPNVFKNEFAEMHGNELKAQSIINLLKLKGVQVLVSQKFGSNIQFICKQFIPIVVFNNQVDEVLYDIKKQIKWIECEAENKPVQYKLFTINHGIIKSSIK